MCNPSSWSDLTFCNDFLLPPFTLFLLHHHHHASFRGGLSFQCSLLVEGSSIPRQDETTHPRNYPISGEKTPRYPAGCWYMGRCSPRFPITGGARMAQFLRLTPSSSFVQGEGWTFLLFRLERAWTPSRIGDFHEFPMNWNLRWKVFFQAEFTRILPSRVESDSIGLSVFEIKFESTFIFLGRKEGGPWSFNTISNITLEYLRFSLNGKFIFFPSLHQ